MVKHVYSRNLEIIFFSTQILSLLSVAVFSPLRRTLDAKIARPRFNVIALCTRPSGRVQLADDRRAVSPQPRGTRIIHESINRVYCSGARGLPAPEKYDGQE